MISVVTCVNHDELSQDAKTKQIELLGKAAFIKAAMNKRKIVLTVNNKRLP
jgi:hypothetical protein